MLFKERKKTIRRKSIERVHRLNLPFLCVLLFTLPCWLSTHPLQAAQSGDLLRIYPFSISVRPYGGAIRVPQQTDAQDETKVEDTFIACVGLEGDLGLTYIQQFLTKHFRSYPDLGLSFHWGKFLGGGTIWGGGIYLVPRYDYLDDFEVLPRLRAGLAHVTIPGENFSEQLKKKRAREQQEVSEEETIAEPAPIREVAPYTEGWHWDLAMALVFDVRVNPHWRISPGIGFHYLASLEEVEGRKPVKMLTSELGISYTINPDDVSFPIKTIPTSRVDLSPFIGFKKRKGSLLKEDETDDAYYIVAGLNTLWSLPLRGNHAFTVAMEILQDNACKKRLENEDPAGNDSWKVAALLGHEFLWGKLLFRQQAGGNVYFAKLSSELPIHLCLGLDYRISKHWFVGLNLKNTLQIPMSDDEEAKICLDVNYADFRIGCSF